MDFRPVAVEALGGPMLRITLSPSDQNTSYGLEEKVCLYLPIQI